MRRTHFMLGALAAIAAAVAVPAATPKSGSGITPRSVDLSQLTPRSGEAISTPVGRVQFECVGEPNSQKLNLKVSGSIVHTFERGCGDMAPRHGGLYDEFISLGRGYSAPGFKAIEVVRTWRGSGGSTESTLIEVVPSGGRILAEGGSIDLKSVQGSANGSRIITLRKGGPDRSIQASRGPLASLCPKAVAEGRYKRRAGESEAAASSRCVSEGAWNGQCDLTVEIPSKKILARRMVSREHPLLPDAFCESI